MGRIIAVVTALALSGCMGGATVNGTGGDSGAGATGGDAATSTTGDSGTAGATSNTGATQSAAASTSGAASTTGTGTSTTSDGTSTSTTGNNATLTLSTGTAGASSTSATSTGSGTTTSTGTSTSTAGSSGTTGIHANTPLDGLTVPTLHFAVLGDCRPAGYVNDPSQVPAKYPTAIVTQIFQRIVARDPDFALFSGDVLYTFNPPDGGSGAAQIDQFLSARDLLDRPFAPALGNHEDDDTVNIPVWSQKFRVLQYYSFTVHTNAGDVQFIVADDTYWNSTQLNQIKTWLSSSAPYHIVLKHHPTDSSEITETTWQQIVAQYPPTLVLTGHSHTYDHPHPNELVLGTAGAPLANAAPGYGYAMVDQIAGGGFQVSAYVTDSSGDNLIDQWTVP